MDQNVKVAAAVSNHGMSIQLELERRDGSEHGLVGVVIPVVPDATRVWVIVEGVGQKVERILSVNGIVASKGVELVHHILRLGREENMRPLTENSGSGQSIPQVTRRLHMLLEGETLAFAVAFVGSCIGTKR